MPATFTYPGLYIEEVPSGVHPIVGASTSDTAFVDYFPRGPVGVATRVTNLEEFQRIFGEQDAQSEASYTVPLYFQNGGQAAWIVRVIPADNPAVATRTLTASSPPQDALRVSAASPGAWGSQVQIAAVETVPADPTGKTFNLFVRERVTQNGGSRVVATEAHRNLNMTTGSAGYAVDVVNAASSLITVEEPTGTPGRVPTLASSGQSSDPPEGAFQSLSTVSDTAVIDTTTGQAVPKFAGALQTGLLALDRIEPFRFNLLCLPATAVLTANDAKATMDAAVAYAVDKRAFLVVDPPRGQDSADEMQTFLLGATAPAPSPNAAVYFPRLSVSDPLTSGRLREVGPSGVVAGVYARTDSTRGTWKAPAGIDATLSGAVPALPLNDADSGRLNPLGINALRTFPVIGSVVWGARTMFGADQRASEWKYVPVRRMALYIENSLFDGLKWVVFEPNDEPLWAQIRLNVGAFMQDLFRQGAFQGATPREAYLVKCDRTTTTQSDIDKGIVNILVGFAPLKPAEFVVIRIQQLAGQSQS
jgi:phage tail sheath protein FI